MIVGSREMWDGGEWWKCDGGGGRLKSRLDEFADQFSVFPARS